MIIPTGHEEIFLEGFFASAVNSRYLMGVNYTATKVKKQFSHAGSEGLDHIHAFDKAEVSSAHLGQTNLIQVSSFCGPKGLIWGYDLCKTSINPNPWGITGSDIGVPAVKINDLNNLRDAFVQLTGSVHKPHFPFLPGSHVPAALKYLCQSGPGVIYAAQAIGIPVDRNRNACLMMEDHGTLPTGMQLDNNYIVSLMLNLSASVITIGKAQNIQFKEILIGIDKIDLEEDEVGCAMAANPYFLMAKHAIPDGLDMASITISDWVENTKSMFMAC